MAGLGILLAVARYSFGWKLVPSFLRRTFSPIYTLIAGRYFIDELYEFLLLGPTRAFSKLSFLFDANVVDGAVNGVGAISMQASRLKRWIDEHWVDGAVNGLALGVARLGGRVRSLQTGQVQNYLFIAFGSVAVIVLLLMKGM